MNTTTYRLSMMAPAGNIIDALNIESTGPNGGVLQLKSSTNAWQFYNCVEGGRVQRAIGAPGHPSVLGARVRERAIG